MATPPDTPLRTTPRLKDVPNAFWAGLAIGLLGFAVKFSWTSTRSQDGVLTSCSYFDLAGFLIAVGLGICAWVTWSPTVQYPAVKPTAALRAGLVAILLALAVIHVLRGLGLILSPC